MSLSVNVIPAGILQANCIILCSLASKSLMIVDPGGDTPKVLDKIKKITGKTDNNFDDYSVSIVLTHARNIQKKIINFTLLT